MRLRKLWRSCEIWPFARGIAENKIWESRDNNWVWNSIDKSFLQFCALFLSIRTAVLPDRHPLALYSPYLRSQEMVSHFPVASPCSSASFHQECLMKSAVKCLFPPPPHLQPDTFFTRTRASLCALPAPTWAHSSLLWPSVENQRILWVINLESG